MAKEFFVALNGVESVPSIGVQGKCPSCAAGLKPVRPHMAEPRGMLHIKDRVSWLCTNYDSECRHIGEPFGWIFFAWLPRLCRNGKTRWLTWLERHGDGTYTHCNRAH